MPRLQSKVQICLDVPRELRERLNAAARARGVSAKALGVTALETLLDCMDDEAAWDEAAAQLGDIEREDPPDPNPLRLAWVPARVEVSDPTAVGFWPMYRTAVEDNDERTRRGLELARVPGHGPSLVVVKTLYHARKVRDLAEPGEVEIVQSFMSESDRARVFERVERGELRVVVVTGAAVSGLDVGMFRQVVNLTAGSRPPLKPIQTIDFDDMGSVQFERMRKKREDAYRDAGYSTVVFVDQAEARKIETIKTVGRVLPCEGAHVG